MPLLRLEVRNEYGLGDPELYRAAAKKKDDPKELLDGVAVAGLVGILRQLGDLAEFASDIFQDLHEQVTAASVRGRKLLTRINHLETALPSFENAVRGQRSHIHFSYVPGSGWHGDLQIEQSHLLSSDLPRFMMDSYEECRDPPHLYLLDKFDSAGPGSCLKRYSDPSYFKRVWATSEPGKAEKVQREKKVQKIKRKGSQIRNEEVEHGISLSGSNSSVRFASPSTNEQHFSTETIPISDMKLKPDAANRSTSFGSRTRLYYDEQFPDTNSSGVPDELEHDRLSLSKFQINQTGSFASDIHDKLNGVCTYDDSPHGSLNAESSHKSPSVTWDEKTEILKPTSPRSCDDILVDGTKYVEPVYSGQSNIETETAVLETVDGRNSIFNTANVQAPLSTVNHIEEVTSETENYMDALNTLESEIETDSECQTKHEVKSLSNFSCPQMESGIALTHEMASPTSDISGADTVSGSHSSSNEDQSPNTYNLMPSESFKPVQPPHPISSIPDPSDSIGIEISEHNAVDMSRMHDFEGVHYVQPLESSFCGSTTALVPRTTADVLSPDSPPGSISSMPKPKFWTNGGLLGLEPSKPPDFGVSKVSREDFASDSIVSGCDHSSSSQVTKLHREIVSASDEIMSRDAIFVKKIGGSPNSSLNQSSLSGDQHFGRSDNVAPSSDPYQHSESYQDNQLDNMPADQNSQSRRRALPLSELEKIHDSLPININAQNGCHVIAPRGSELPSSNSVESQPDESSHNTLDIASSISALAQRIIANSLQRKPSITHTQYGDVNTDINKSQDTSLLNNQKGQTRVVSEACYAENIDTIHSMSLKNSISSNSCLSGHSSPPLEHMKISFHPMNGLEPSKLKLEYAGGNFHESIEDLTFPSFQLLPRPSVQLEDYGSETDDDTFCRSCPCTSEDHLSPRSDSNSELWGQDDISGGKKYEMCENLSRMSLSGSSVSSFKGFDTSSGFGNLEAYNSILYFQNGNCVGLPGLDSFTSTHDKGKCDSLSSDPVDSASKSQNGLPPPPPLPPKQWRMTKSSDKHEENDSSVAEMVEHFNVLQTQVTTGHKQQEPHIPKPPPFPETMACPIKKSHDGQLNGHKETRNIDVSSKQLDGREELLHQIRSKTFSLRCTTTAKPPLELQPTTNINVAAILEKAYAIRQAIVGSKNGGGDDNWSDG